MNNKIITICILLIAACGCAHIPEAAEVASKYSEETARAIIEGSWHIAYAICIAAFIRGFLNK